LDDTAFSGEGHSHFVAALGLDAVSPCASVGSSERKYAQDGCAHDVPRGSLRGEQYHGARNEQTDGQQEVQQQGSQYLRP
jgi:hypothetical protein